MNIDREMSFLGTWRHLKESIFLVKMQQMCYQMEQKDLVHLGQACHKVLLLFFVITVITNSVLANIQFKMISVISYDST